MLRFSFALLGGLIAVLMFVDVGRDLLAGRQIDFPALHSPARTLSALTLVALALAGLAFGLFWASASTLEAHGIRGFTFGGRRIHIPWLDVASVHPATLHGVPAAVVRSAASGKQIWICTLGLDAAAIHEHIRTYAGPDHVLAQWFTPRSA